MMKKRQKNKSFDSKLYNPHKLARIIEDPLEMLEDEVNMGYSITRRAPQMILPEIFKDKSSETSFYHEFFLKLSRNRAVYSFFVSEFASLKPLAPIRPEPSLSSLSSNKFLLDSSRISKASLYENSSSKELLSNKATLKPIIFETKNFPNSARGSIIMNPTLHAAFKAQVLDKYMNFQKHSEEISEKFKEISGNTSNISKDSLREFLMRRYSHEVVENAVKWIYHGLSVNFEGWVNDLQSFITLPDEKHLRMAFSLYDFNKDKFICNNDAFHAITLLDSRYFTQDLIKIRGQLLSKAQYEAEQKLMPVKIMSLHKMKLLYDEKKVKINTIPGKPEALTFEDFTRIHFESGKPRVILDLFEYLTGIEPNESKPVSYPRRNSEEIADEMYWNPEVKDKYNGSSMLSYYLDLGNLIRSYQPDYCKAILEKFHEMSSQEYMNGRFLSFKSVVEKWPKYFGVDNLFVAESIYRLLAGQKNYDISKVKLLKEIKQLFDENTQNFFAFSVYDKNKDGQITCDELNEFFVTLTEGSVIYKECLILVNEFVASIFGKRHKPVNKIDFLTFNELIPRSVLIEEFIKSLITKEDNRRNLAFLHTSSLSESELESFNKYIHINKHIEFGEVTNEVALTK